MWLASSGGLAHNEGVQKNNVEKQNKQFAAPAAVHNKTRNL